MPAGPTPHLDIDRMDEGESGIVRFNEAIDAADCLVHLAVINQTTSAQPVSPTEGDRYLINPTATGTDWAGHDDEIACFINAQWVFKIPDEGWLMYDEALDILYSYDGAAWNAEGGAGGAAPSNATYVTVSAEAGLTAERVLTGTADQIIVTDNTTTVDLSLPTTGATQRFAVPGTGAMQPPIGTTGQRPSTPVNGDMRYNSTDDVFEVREGGAWVAPSQTGGGTGAPTTAEYVVVTAHAGLSNERVLTGTADQIIVTDNTTTIDLSLPTTGAIVQLDVPGTGSLVLPQGTDAQRPSSPVNGMVRYNSEFNFIEYRENGAWVRPSQVPVGGGVAFEVMRLAEFPVLAVNPAAYDVDTILVFTPAANTSYRFRFDLWANVHPNAELYCRLVGPILTASQGLLRASLRFESGSDVTEILNADEHFNPTADGMLAGPLVVGSLHYIIEGMFINETDLTPLGIEFARLAAEGNSTVHKGSTLTVWTY